MPFDSLWNTRCGFPSCARCLVDLSILNIDVVLLHILDHEIDQIVQIIFMLPIPVASCIGIIEHLRPGVGDLLSTIRLVDHMQMGHMFAQFLDQLLGRERHGSHIVDATLQLLSGCAHKLKQCPKNKRNILNFYIIFCQTCSTYRRQSSMYIMGRRVSGFR